MDASDKHATEGIAHPPAEVDAAYLDHVSADEARVALRPLLRSALIDQDSANQLYRLLHGWTWAALDQRRRDDDLRAWHAIFGSVEATLRNVRPEISWGIRQMKALINESIVAADLLAPDKALQRAHVRALIDELLIDGWHSRDAVRTKLEMEQANFTRVVNIAVAAGLVEKRVANDGRSQDLRATELGRQCAAASARKAERPANDVKTVPSATLHSLPKGKGYHAPTFGRTESTVSFGSRRDRPRQAAEKNCHNNALQGAG